MRRRQHGSLLCSAHSNPCSMLTARTSLTPWHSRLAMLQKLVIYELLLLLPDALAAPARVLILLSASLMARSRSLHWKLMKGGKSIMLRYTTAPLWTCQPCVRTLGLPQRPAPP